LGPVVNNDGDAATAHAIGEFLNLLCLRSMRGWFVCPFGLFVVRRPLIGFKKMGFHSRVL